MSHQYCTHIKNKSLHGYMACGIPFKTLYDAEEYCMKKDVKPDANHLVYDPETAASVARALGLELEYVCMKLEDAKNKVDEKLKALCAERDRLKVEGHDIWTDSRINTLHSQIREQIGRFSGLTEAQTLVHNRKYELWEISRIPRLLRLSRDTKTK